MTGSSALSLVLIAAAVFCRLAAAAASAPHGSVIPAATVSRRSSGVGIFYTGRMRPRSDRTNQPSRDGGITLAAPWIPRVIPCALDPRSGLGRSNHSTGRNQGCRKFLHSPWAERPTLTIRIRGLPTQVPPACLKGMSEIFTFVSSLEFSSSRNILNNSSFLHMARLLLEYRRGHRNPPRWKYLLRR